MTGPFAFLDTPEQDTTKTKSPFSFLDTQKDNGVFSYLGNLATNFTHAVAAQGYNTNDPIISSISNFIYRNNPDARRQIQSMQATLKSARMEDSDTAKVLKDKFQPSNLYDSFKNSVGNFFDNASQNGVGQTLGGMITSLPQSLASIPGSFGEGITGVDLTSQSGQGTVLPPEVRAQRIKDASAIIVTGAVSATARFAILKGLEKAALAGTAGASVDVAQNIIQKGGKLGILGNKIVRAATVGSAEGAIGGATFGAVSGAGDEDQFGKIIGGLMFAPLGMAAELIGAKVKGGDSISEIQQKAGNILALRQLSYSPDKSLFDLTKSVEAIATSNNLSEAANKIELSPSSKDYWIEEYGPLKYQVLMKRWNKLSPAEQAKAWDYGGHEDIDLVNAIELPSQVSTALAYYDSGIPKRGMQSKNFPRPHELSPEQAAGAGGYENLRRAMIKEVPSTPEISTQNLNTLLSKGEPGISIEPTPEGSTMIKVAARDEAGNPIGLLTLKKTGEKSADVFTVYVDADSRRQGIATKLYDAAENAGYKLQSGKTGLSPEGKAFIQNRVQIKDFKTPFDKIAEQTVKEYTDNLYDEFKSLTDTPENVQGFDDNFNKFAQLRGINPEDSNVLKNEFINRVHNEIHDALPLEERPLYRKMQLDLEKAKSDIVENGSNKLRTSAIENNAYFDQADAGVIHLRDYDTNKSLGTFHSVEAAQTYLDNIGKPPDTINLDGNGKVPPEGSKPAAIPPNIGPLNPPPSGWLEKKYALWTTRLSFATANPTLFKNWDTIFGSTLHAKVFNIVDAAAKLSDGKKSVWLKQLKAADNVLGKATQADREHVFNWMETRSIQEHEQKGGVGGKPLSPLEMALGKQITNADLTNMYRYKNAMRSVGPKSPEFAATDAAMRKQFNIGPNEDNALTLLSIAEKNQVQKVSIGSSVHYARLLQNPELALTRAEYAKKFNLKPNQIQTGIALDNYFNGLADVAGISKDKILFNYITHARLYENGSLPDAIAKYALDKPTEEFYAALNRTGELSTIERDPIRAALRYTNALFDTLYLNPAINAAKENLKLELAKLPEGSGLKVERDANKYLQDVRHIPAIGDKYADAAVNHMLNNTGINVERGISRKWVNAANEVFTVAAQGARPWAGIRDFYSNTTKYYVKWGAKDAALMLKYGAEADLDKLRQSGLIENYTQLGLNSAVDEAASALSNAGSRFKGLVDKTAHKAMQLSGQQMVNDMARAGAFLVTRNKVAGMLRDLHSGKFGDVTKPETFSKAYNSIQLERYSPAVFTEFDRQIKLNKTDEAANYLGNQHIQETFGNYANANHPSGWNNNFGRLVGKFGQWSINHRDYVVSLASRGTRVQRLQALGRLAITESAVASAATLLGVNLSNLYSIPGMYFKGGPAGDLFYTAYNAMFGKGMEQESAIRKVQQLLPYDQVNDKMKGSIVVPFSFALTDLVEGMEMASNGDVAGGLARIGGVRPMSDNYQPSKFEETIGNIIGGR